MSQIRIPIAILLLAVVMLFCIYQSPMAEAEETIGEQYLITFLDEDGTILSEQTYHWGDKVTAPAVSPKALDHVYAYAFAEWDQEVVDCAGNATYTATYRMVYVEYNLVFTDWSGNVISSATGYWDDFQTMLSAAYPGELERAADDAAAYTFDSWDVGLEHIDDATYILTFTPTYISHYIDYIVTFQYEDGTVIEQLSAHYGDAVTAPVPAAPEGYVFVGWDQEVVACAGNATYTAVFESVCTPGDMNGDGLATDADALHLLRYVLFPDQYPVSQDADMNGDGMITDADALYLLRYVLFPELYPLYKKD